MKRFFTYHLSLITLILLSCSSSPDPAEAMLNRAKEEFAAKQYTKALSTIDSLRHAFPEAIETRKQALTLYQDISLQQAQEDLALTDSALQAVKAQYATMKAHVDSAKAQLRATAEELQTLTLTKIKLDSLQTRFDVQCEKIKYIHKKQAENQQIHIGNG